MEIELDRLLKQKLDHQIIIANRNKIKKDFLVNSIHVHTPSISKISADDLDILFGLYDQQVLNGWFGHHFKGKMKFSLSRRMTKSAGLTLCPRNITKPEDLVIQIKIGIDFFFNFDVLDNNKQVCGLDVQDSLEALLLVFEHELCHAMEFILHGKSSCKKERFKTIAKNLFGHLDSYHQLPTHRQIVKEQLGITVGSKVSFDFEGKRLNGVIYRLNKRATVMVKDKKGQYTDKKGRRYTKYYVPVSAIIR